jgi:hypothetical protein
MSDTTWPDPARDPDQEPSEDWAFDDEDDSEGGRAD